VEERGGERRNLLSSKKKARPRPHPLRTRCLFTLKKKGKKVQKKSFPGLDPGGRRQSELIGIGSLNERTQSKKKKKNMEVTIQRSDGEEGKGLSTIE